MIDRPATRYGTRKLPRRSRRWILVAVFALVVVLGVGVAVAGWQRIGDSDVKGELAAYHLVDSQTVSVTIGVTRKDPSQPVVCVVRARSLDGSETGRREILVLPSQDTTVQITTIVRTTEPPVMGDVYGCGTDVPSYLVAP